MDKKQASQHAAMQIMEDLLDRRGVGDEIANCDTDVRREIQETMAEIIELNIEAVKS